MVSCISALFLSLALHSMSCVTSCDSGSSSWETLVESSSSFHSFSSLSFNDLYTRLLLILRLLYCYDHDYDHDILEKMMSVFIVLFLLTLLLIVISPSRHLLLSHFALLKPPLLSSSSNFAIQFLYITQDCVDICLLSEIDTLAYSCTHVSFQRHMCFIPSLKFNFGIFDTTICLFLLFKLPLTYFFDLVIEKLWGVNHTSELTVIECNFSPFDMMKDCHLSYRSMTEQPCKLKWHSAVESVELEDDAECKQTDITDNDVCWERHYEVIVRDRKVTTKTHAETNTKACMHKRMKERKSSNYSNISVHVINIKSTQPYVDVSNVLSLSFGQRILKGIIFEISDLHVLLLTHKTVGPPFDYSTKKSSVWIQTTTKLSSSQQTRSFDSKNHFVNTDINWLLKRNEMTNTSNYINQTCIYNDLFEFEYGIHY